MRKKAISPQPVLAFAVPILALHLLASVFLPSHGWVTCVGLSACYGLAWWVGILQSRRVAGTMRIRWILISAGFALGVASFLLTLVRESVLAIPGGIAGVQDVTLLLRGLPFLIAVALSKRERSPIFVRLDFAQGFLAVGVACVAFLFAFPNPEGGYVPVSSILAIDRLAIANLVVAIAVTIRLFASTTGGADTAEDRRFFKMVCGFLWANAVVTGFVNLVVIGRWAAQPGSVLLVLGDLPILAMALACSLPDPPKAPYRTPRKSGSLIESGSSFLFPFFIFVMAASIVQVHFFLGMSCVTLTFLLYALRTTILQTRYLSAQEELRQVNDRIRDQALLDGLTGIPNRRSFDLSLNREWKRAKRTGQPIALLLLDIDHFKMLNDTYGHLTGDACLKEIAGVLKQRLGREVDFAARYGGEEFAVLLADTGSEGASTVAEMLRCAIERHRFDIKEFEGTDKIPPAVTVSIGIASIVPRPPDEVHPDDNQDHPSILIAAADEALYRAKRNGRNRAEIYEGSVRYTESGVRGSFAPAP